MKELPSNQVAGVMLTVLIIALLIVGSFWTLLPFLGALVWATTIVVATWPVLLLLQRHLGGKRSLATTVLTITVLLVFIVPFALAISAVVDAADRSPAVLRDFLARGLGPPPEWLSGLPLVGERFTQRWHAIASGGPEALVAAVKPYTLAAATWIVAATGGIGMLVVQVLLMLILIGILYAHGETAARGVLAFAFRIGGRRGEDIVRLAGQAVRSVALGVIVTALVQSLLAGLGLWIAGVPHPGLLTAIVFVLGIAQIGPLPVMAVAVSWLYWTGNAGWGTALLVWSIPVIALDNVLRPILIKRGVQLPMLLIIGGVIGGLIGFGVMGLFVGPVILAATYTLAKAWVAEDPAPVLATPLDATPSTHDAASTGELGYPRT